MIIKRLNNKKCWVWICTYLIRSKFINLAKQVRQSANQLKTIVYIIILTERVDFIL